MIWILLATYYLGGGLDGVNGSLLTSDAVKQLRVQAETIITDPARVEAAQGTLKELKKEIDAFEKKFGKKGGELNKAYKDHESRDQQAFDLINDLNSDWKGMQFRAIELRFQLRDQMTETEWQELFTDSFRES